MEEDNFYYVLPSNVKSKDYMENKTSYYLTSFPKPMELNKNGWEVAVVELSYPHTWYNINETISYINCTKYDPDDGVQVTFPPGHYTGYTLAERLNYSLTEFDMRSNFTYEAGGNKIRLELFPDEGIELPKRLAVMMGWWTDNEFVYRRRGRQPHVSSSVNPNIRDIFPEITDEDIRETTTPVYYSERYYADQCMDLNYSTHHLYIYCNLIGEIMVGDIYAKLMRTVTTRSENYGQYVTNTFTSPHYLPLASSFENHVEISIRNDGGTLVPFESGKVIVTLHFRKRK